MDIEAGAYLIDAMNEMGPAVSNGWGLVVTPWAEIRAYCDGRFEQWEVSLLRNLCLAWLDGYRSGSHPLSIPPMDRTTE